MAPTRRLLCVYQHAPTRGAPGIYRHRLYLAELVRRGWAVDLISTPVNYMTGEVAEAYAGRAYLRETLDGIVHHWVWASKGIHASKGRRAANYVSFAMAATARAATLPRPSVVLASSPPLTIGAVGSLLAARFRRPWVLEVRDAWPESASSVGWLSERSLAYKGLLSLARSLTSSADGVIVPTPGLVEVVRSHGAGDVAVIPGAVIDAEPSEEQRLRVRQKLGVDPQTRLFLYIGAMGVANGLDVLLDAVGLLPAGVPAAFVLAGDGSARAALVKRLGATADRRVMLLGAVSKERVADLLAASDVCLHVLRPDALFRTALPSKVLEYMGAHRPFVTTVRGLPEELARAAGGGFAETAEGLAAELKRWAELTDGELRKHGEMSFLYGVGRFGVTASADRLESTLLDAAARTRGRRRSGKAGGRRDVPEA